MLISLLFGEGVFIRPRDAVITAPKTCAWCHPLGWIALLAFMPGCPQGGDELVVEGVFTQQHRHPVPFWQEIVLGLYSQSSVANWDLFSPHITKGGAIMTNHTQSYLRQVVRWPNPPLYAESFTKTESIFGIYTCLSLNIGKDVRRFCRRYDFFTDWVVLAICRLHCQRNDLTYESQGITYE